MYNFLLLAFMGFLATFAPFCEGNNFITKGVYGIIILIMFALNVNDIIGVLTKEDEEPKEEITDYLTDIDYMEVLAGIVSSFLLIRAAYTRECSAKYLIIIIVAPIMVVISIILAGTFSLSLGITSFEPMNYLPSSVKKVNSIIGILPEPKKINEDVSSSVGDISTSVSSVTRSVVSSEDIEDE